MRPFLRVRWGIALASLALLAGCAPSLMPKEQEAAIRSRERGLSGHSAAIQDAIRHADTQGALAFLDSGDNHLVVAPGDTPIDAWTRYVTDRGADRGQPPPVLSFVYRADVPRPPESIPLASLERERREDQAHTQALAALESALRETQRRTDERLTALARTQTELADGIGASREEAQHSIASTRAELQRSIESLAEEIAAARSFMLETAKLGRLNHDLTAENAQDVRRMASASQQMATTAAGLADSLRQLSERLTAQLKDLAERLDALQNKVGTLK